MTITVNPITPVKQTASADNKVADNNAPEVPFGHVLAKEVAQHQPAKAGETSKGEAGKRTKSLADITDNTANQPQITAQTPTQISSEMLSMMGISPQSPTTGAASTSTPLVNTSGISARADIGLKTTSLPDKLMPASNNLASTTMQSNKDIPATLAGAADITNDKTSVKPTDKTEPTNFSDLLKSTASVKERMPVTQADLPTIPQIQTSAVNLAASNPGMIMSDKITARVGTPAWDQSLSQKIVWMSNNAQQTASLTLNPPDLGPLQIVLSVNNDQANATFIAAQPEVRLAIEAAMPKLREMMSDAGIQLGQANVSSGSTPQQNNHQQERPSSNNSQSLNSIDESITLNSAHRSTNITTGLGLVNTFA
jgi:flagellar hook-length control protein FliK